MTRVSKSMDAQGDAFALFQTATALEQTIKERTAALEQTNEELKAALAKEKAMAKARDEALDSSQLKSQFLANMSHEIRTPMNGVIGMTSLLLDTPLNDEQLDYVNIVRTSGESLLTIINDILDFSKIEARKMILERQPFDLRTCIEEALDLVVGSASEKGLEVLYHCDPDVPAVITSDVTRLRQILVNLLSNAVKFTTSGEVLVSVSVAELIGSQYSIEITVKDSGIGIPEDRVGSLFDAFSQVDASTTRKYGGTGLGLAISYQLASLLGGGLRAESVLGHGSSFILSILAPASRSDQPPHRDTSELLNSKRILIVDDNATNRRILSSLIHGKGMKPTVCASAAEVLALINQGDTFDAALLDFHMPEMDGLSLAQTLSHHEKASNLPLVMLSSIGDRPADEEGLFNAWLTKPVKPNQLMRVLQGLFGAVVPEQIETAAMPNIVNASMRILLAEDNAINQKVAIRMLDRMGYRADVVANGVEAIRSIEQIPYDIILMDMMMPEMDGIEATRRIRAHKSIKQPYIIALTANAMEEDRKKCMDAGMDDYLSKPINSGMLATALQRCA